MKILVVGDFDPCGVHLRHRKYLRELGVDYRLAVKHCYRKEAEQADYWCDRPNGGRTEYADMRWFAKEADVIQLLPAIQQPWTFQETEPRFETLKFIETDWFGDPWFASATKAVCFHGSLNAWANRQVYADHWRARGVPILATTIDYAWEMGAEYLPSIVDCGGGIRLREDSERLRVMHSPTDPALCRTTDFLHLCRSLDVDVTYVTGANHENVLTHKRHHSVGYDHMRGCYSINSLENVAHGMVNLVGIDERYESALGDIPLPWPCIREWADLERWLVALRDPGETRRWQLRARGWFSQHWTPMAVAKRLLGVYERIRASG